MSLHKRYKTDPETGEKILKSPYWQIDKRIALGDGTYYRLRCSSGVTSRSKALAIRDQLVAKIIQNNGPSPEMFEDRSQTGMNLAEAATRYFQEMRSSQRRPQDLAKNLEHCVRLIGGATPMKSIDAEMIADAMHRRSGETGPGGKPIALSTVNRQIKDTMSALWRRANRVWMVDNMKPEPVWRTLALKTDPGRERILSDEETEIFWRELRPDYRPIMLFGSGQGLRFSEYLLQRRQVDLSAGTVALEIGKKGGGFRTIVKRLTPREADLLETEMRKAPGVMVFTYEVQRGPDKGMRKPITHHGMKSEMRRYMDRLRGNYPGLFVDLRFHDLRHDFATRYLRHTGNLETVSKAVNHSSLRTTQRYVHLAAVDKAETLDDFHDHFRPGAINPRTIPAQGRSHTGREK